MNITEKPFSITLATEGETHKVDTVNLSTTDAKIQNFSKKGSWKREQILEGHFYDYIRLQRTGEELITFSSDSVCFWKKKDGQWKCLQSLEKSLKVTHFYLRHLHRENNELVLLSGKNLFYFFELNNETWKLKQELKIDGNKSDEIISIHKQNDELIALLDWKKVLYLKKENGNWGCKQQLDISHTFSKNFSHLQRLGDEIFTACTWNEKASFLKLESGQLKLKQELTANRLFHISSMQREGNELIVGTADGTLLFWNKTKPESDSWSLKQTITEAHMSLSR